MLREIKDQIQRTTLRTVGGKRSIIRLFALSAILLLVILVFAYYWRFLTVPKGNGTLEKVFDFSSGYTMKKISEELTESRIIGNAALFSLYARVKGDDARIQAGTYRFNDGMPPAEILDKLVNGDVFQIRFVVPEGYSIFQLAELLEKRGISSRKEFLEKCFDRTLLNELDIPGKSVEGFLSPRTYIISPDMKASKLIREMVARFRSTYNAKYAARAHSLGLGELEVLTLASMIEKEAVMPEERPLISSVFHNRLERSMPLQSDPTSVYGVRAFAGKISKRDILRETPYNTYRIKGLPPGPIGNPGDASIEAALSPAHTPYLYFVARMDGSHHFSATLAEHNNAVRKYLRSAD